MAVGMKRALDSAIGLPSRSTSASWMLRFLIPDDVRRALTVLAGLLWSLAFRRRERLAVGHLDVHVIGRDSLRAEIRPLPHDLDRDRLVDLGPRGLHRRFHRGVPAGARRAARLVQADDDRRGLSGP